MYDTLNNLKFHLHRYEINKIHSQNRKIHKIENKYLNATEFCFPKTLIPGVGLLSEFVCDCHLGNSRN